MSLSVIGKESLDELEIMVLEMFSDIENKDVETPRWPEHLFKEEHFQNKWFIVPIKDIRNLNMTFPIPDLHEHYRSKPAYYWSHLIGHEGKGSLLSALKEKGWCNALMSGKQNFARGFGFFCINVDLTEEGIKHVDDIIALTFQCINMIKQEGAIEEIFREYSDIASMNFRFSEKSSPQFWVNKTVVSLQEYPIEEVLSGPRLITEWRPDLINELKDYLVPENIRVHVLGKIFESEADSVERWYRTKYHREKIPAEEIENWKNAGTNEALHLTEKNEFVPTKFDIKPFDTVVDKFPVVIEDNPFIRLWFKQDDEFLLPKATMTFDFVSPYAYIDPISCAMTDMFTELLHDSLNEYAYNAELAGSTWELSNDKYGLCKMIDKKSSHCRKLSVHVLSTAEGGAAHPEVLTSSEENKNESETTQVEEGPLQIKDILQFKASHPLYPLSKPFNNVPRKGTSVQDVNLTNECVP